MAAKGCIINMLCSRRGKAALCALIASAALALWLLLRPAAPVSAAPDTPEGLTAYDVTVKLLPETREIAVTETIVYRNDTGDTLDQLTLRTFLNAYRDEESSPAATQEFFDACYPEGFSPGYLTVYEIFWNGQRVTGSFADGACTVLTVPLPPLEDGEVGEMTLRFTGQIPACAHRTGETHGIWQLGNVIPQIPLYQDHAFRTDAYIPIGDPFVSPCADYTVHLFLPEGYVPACSALLQKAADGGWHGSIRAARDVALCVSRDYKIASARAGSTVIRAYARSDAGARAAADDARRAVETFQALYGPYPYPSLSVCEADFPFGGMEYSGLVMVSGDYFAQEKRDTLEVTVAHEAAHQWFYGLVGSDQVFSPWQDEALCQWAALRYVRKMYGQGSYETLKYYQVDAPMMENVPGSLTPGSPIDYFGTLGDYSTVVYGRGAALLAALDEMLPKGADDFLRAYADAYRYQFVTRQEFEALLNRYAGMDCFPLLLDYLDTAH